MKNYMKNAVFVICGLFLVTVSLFAGAVQNIPLRKSHDTEGNRSIAPISAFIDGTSLYSSFLGVTGIVEIVITSKSTGEVVCQKTIATVQPEVISLDLLSVGEYGLSYEIGNSIFFGTFTVD